MALQREEKIVSAEIARHNLRAFDQLLAQPLMTLAELKAALRASLTGLQVAQMFLHSSIVYRHKRSNDARV